MFEPSNSDNRPLSIAEIREEVTKSQNFLEATLQPQLEQAVAHHNTFIVASEEHMKLKSTIEAIRFSKQKTLKTKVDLGCGVFCQANASDTSFIYVAVGHGFHLQLTLAEALEYIDKKLALIRKRSEEAALKVASVKAHVQAINEGIDNLLKL